MADPFLCKTDETKADANSLCAALKGTPYENIVEYCDKCDAPPIMVAASSQDWCLKQLGDDDNPIFYRERLANIGAVGASGVCGYSSAVGAYILDGYDSIIRFAPIFGENMLSILEKVLLNYVAAPADEPGKIVCRIGVSGQAYDPNFDEGCIKWHDLTARELKCLTKVTTSKVFKNVTPDRELRWDFLYSAKFIFVELKVSGTGSDAKFSGVILNARGESAFY